jgi:Rrf2 family protein
MVDLAYHESEGPVLVKHIAERQAISKKYLDNLLVSLKNAGLLRSVRGAKGGYSLAKPVSKITVEDIAVALEGSPTLVDCVADSAICSRVTICPTIEFWRSMSEVLGNFMRNTSLEDLVRNSREKQARESKMYFL